MTLCSLTCLKHNLTSLKDKSICVQLKACRRCLKLGTVLPKVTKQSLTMNTILQRLITTHNQNFLNVFASLHRILNTITTSAYMTLVGKKSSLLTSVITQPQRLPAFFTLSTAQLNCTFLAQLELKCKQQCLN